MDKDVELRFKVLEDRVNKLENTSLKNKDLIVNIDKSLSVTIEQMKNISEDLKTTSINFKEAIMRSNTAYTKETQEIKEKVIDLEKKYEKLDTKIDKETIEKDAEEYRSNKKQIISYVINVILAIVVFALGINKFI